MLSDKPSPADEAARERELRRSLKAYPRILDVIAQGAFGGD